MKLSEKLLPLFELLDHKHKQVDLVIITGGRLGSKSYGVSTFITEALVQHDWSTLYTRFTNVSGQDSTVPEVQEKIDLLNYNNYVNVSNNRIESANGSKIVFKGLKAGSNAQSANLKSLKDFNCWVVDEAEEIPTFETFDKIFLSIRHPEKRNLTILVLNPTVRDFWLYKKFFQDKNIPDLYNGIKGNVMYIHTNYLDVPREVIPDSIWNNYQERKINDPEDYNETILGAWISYKEGQLFKPDDLQRFSLSDLNLQNVETKIGFIDVANQGEDRLCFPIGYVIGEFCYIVDVVFSSEDMRYTVPYCAAKINEHSVNLVVVETNSFGISFYNDLNDMVNIDLQPLHQTANKHKRIVGESYNVKKYLKFRNDYEQGSEYDLYMREIFSYTKDGKADHDDAPDATCGISLLRREISE